MIMRRAVLLVVNALLVMAIAAVLLGDDEERVGSPEQKDRTAEAAPIMAPYKGAAVALARPLFRPLSDSIAGPVPQTTPIATQARIRLVGVILGQGRQTGWIEENGSLRKIVEGDEVQGWRVKSIAPRSLTLVRDGHVMSYVLDPRPGGT